MAAKDAVDNLMGHLENISKISENPFVVIALDGENAWEYYKNDGYDFLNLLYERLSESKGIKTVTVSEFLKEFPPQDNIKRLSASSWIFGDFSKWIGKREKNIAWKFLTKARMELDKLTVNSEQLTENIRKAYKQIYICEGSDWFWWYGENSKEFDELFRKHLKNFYILIGKDIPDCFLKSIQ